MKRLIAIFSLSVVALGVMGYRHFGPRFSHIDSSRYALPEGDVPPAARIVGKLEVEVDDHRLEGATGCLVNYKSVTLILTAKHLFGPAGGLSELSDSEMTRDVKKVALHSAQGGLVYTSTRALYLAGSESSDEEPDSVSHDIAAMLVEQPAHGLAIATEAAKVGDRVWIILNDGEELTARVTESTPLRLVYQFEKGVAGRGSSGAPILDDKGALVGIHLRFGSSGGSGNPAASILAHLAPRIR